MGCKMLSLFFRSGSRTVKGTLEMGKSNGKIVESTFSRSRVQFDRFNDPSRSMMGSGVPPPARMSSKHPDA